MADREHNSEWISEVRNNESREDSLRIIENALEKDSDNALLWVEAADLSLPPRSRGKRSQGGKKAQTSSYNQPDRGKKRTRRKPQR